MTVKMCRKGLHEMTPDNAGVQRSTGRTFCRACKAAYRRRRRREMRPPTGLCSKGLHPVPESLHVTPGGKRYCKPCRAERAAEAKRRRAAERAAAAAPPAAPRKPRAVVPPAGVRVPGRRGNREAAARYRLALLVRAQRRVGSPPSPT